MDFLLECIGFPPGHDLAGLVEVVRARGEPVPWRGPGGEHLRLPLGAGLELRVDREEGSKSWTILPCFRAPHRLRVALTAVERPEDSPFDALIEGWADPPLDGIEGPPGPPGAYRIAASLWDARRLPARLEAGRVLAVSVAGFALDVARVGPNAEVSDARILERPRGAWVQPLPGGQDPGGCVNASLRVREVRRASNPITREPVDLLETDAPGRPLPIFVSRWQLAQDGLPAPRPGWRVEGTFLLTGRVAGGLPSSAERLGASFG